MTATTCRHCGNEIDARIQQCPHCGVPRPIAEGAAKPEGGGLRIALSLLSVLAGFGGLVMVALIVVGAWKSQPQERTHSALDAWTICQQKVERRLIAPRTAKWPWGYSQYTTHLGGGRYRIATHVDAHNAFGVPLRYRVHCVVQWVSGDSYRVETLDVTPWTE